MLKKNKWTMLVTSLLILLPIVVGVALWDRLPEQMPIHWNAAGEVDDWCSKAQGVFMMPGVLLAVHWVCVLVTGQDPKNKDKNEKAKVLILWLVPVLSLMVNGLVFASALDRDVNVQTLLPVFLGVVFVMIGNYLPKCSRNSTIGLKLPWTLHSDENWNATHRLAGKIWIPGGVAMAATVFLPGKLYFWAMLAVAAVMVFVPTGYSYWFYKTYEENQE